MTFDKDSINEVFVFPEGKVEIWIRRQMSDIHPDESHIYVIHVGVEPRGAKILQISENRKKLAQWMREKRGDGGPILISSAAYGTVAQQKRLEGYYLRCGFKWHPDYKSCVMRWPE